MVFHFFLRLLREKKTLLGYIMAVTYTKTGYRDGAGRVIFQQKGGGEYVRRKTKSGKLAFTKLKGGSNGVCLASLTKHARRFFSAKTDQEMSDAADRMKGCMRDTLGIVKQHRRCEEDGDISVIMETLTASLLAYGKLQRSGIYDPNALSRIEMFIRAFVYPIGHSTSFMSGISDCLENFVAAVNDDVGYDFIIMYECKDKRYTCFRAVTALAPDGVYVVDDKAHIVIHDSVSEYDDNINTDQLSNLDREVSSEIDDRFGDLNLR